jgi:hypothetical protein
MINSKLAFYEAYLKKHHPDKNIEISSLDEFKALYAKLNGLKSDCNTAEAFHLIDIEYFCWQREELKSYLNAKCTIDCTGDVCVGDEIYFVKTIFKGSINNPIFSHYENIYAKVIKDSYGEKKQQQTFTMQCLLTGRKFNIKGRNVYRNGTRRIPWDQEDKRQRILDEKHARSALANKMRKARKSGSKELTKYLYDTPRKNDTNELIALLDRGYVNDGNS